MEQKESKELRMSFDPKTIEHLGVKMYSHIPPALAELIANSYDACATEVHIKLYDVGEKKIIVEDNGTGMSFDEINTFFLRIGRNRREENQKSSCKRTPTGKKGLGKLALFGLGNRISISTVKNNNKVNFILDWDEITNWENQNYTPKFEENETIENSGTTFILEQLNSVSDFPLNAYAINIAKLFNFKDEKFKVYLSLNEGEPILIDNKLKYESIIPEFVWDFPATSTVITSNFSKRGNIHGRIISTEKPLRPGLRGITLFANGRMVNAQEFFGATESSHFFSYTTGWLDVDFIDDMKKDLIATDRQSINWETDLTTRLKNFLIATLRYLEQDWRNKRKEKRKENVQKKTKVNIDDWLKTVPKEIKEKLDVLIAKVDESELSETDQSETIENLHALVPEYPQYHWRYLNDNIKTVSKVDYENGDYLRAAGESIKLYEKEVKRKSKVDKIGVDLMGKAFGPDTEPLKVSPNVTETHKNIEKGQKHMSMGVISGFRNPAMHEPKSEIYPAIYNDVDCLDLLSMISYLFNKLDNARNINE